MSNDIKKCPFCAEEIKKDAIKCKFCGEIINSGEHQQLYTCTRCKSIYSSKLLSCPICGKNDAEERYNALNEEGLSYKNDSAKRNKKTIRIILYLILISMAFVLTHCAKYLTTH